MSITEIEKVNSMLAAFYRKYSILMMESCGATSQMVLPFASFNYTKSEK